MPVRIVFTIMESPSGSKGLALKKRFLSWWRASKQILLSRLPLLCVMSIFPMDNHIGASHTMFDGKLYDYSKFDETSRLPIWELRPWPSSIPQWRPSLRYELVRINEVINEKFGFQTPLQENDDSLRKHRFHPPLTDSTRAGALKVCIVMFMDWFLKYLFSKTVSYVSRTRPAPCTASTTTHNCSKDFHKF